MVYPGHPSTGCVQCKARRIKCDANRPSCLRCTKSGIVCPGYPEKALKFQDVTDRTRDKAHLSYVKSKRRQDSPSSSDNLRKLGPFPFLVASPQLGHAADLAKPALLQGAIAAFMSHSRTSNTIFGVASTLYVRNVQPLVPALEAFALMSMAVQTEAQAYNVRDTAMRQYSTSLRCVNRALGDPEQSLTDATIMAIFLLAMLEVYVDPPTLQSSAQSPGQPRTAHLNRSQHGLAHFLAILNIMKIRGVQQFATLSGRQLFLSAALNWHAMVMPVPKPLPFPISDELCERLIAFTDDEDAYSYQLVPLFNRNTILRRESLLKLSQARLQPSAPEPIYDILTRIEALDRDFREWTLASPSKWSRDMPMMPIRHLFRVCAYQIFAEDLRVRCFRALTLIDGQSRLQDIRNCASKTLELVSAVCAVIPYDFAPDNPKARAKHASQTTTPTKRVDILYHSTFAFPLLVSAMVDAGMSDTQREGIRRARRACATAMGMADSVRDFPRVLVQLVDRHDDMLQCPRCGSEHHYDGQKCRHNQTEAEDALIKQNKAALDRLEAERKAK